MRNNSNQNQPDWTLRPPSKLEIFYSNLMLACFGAWFIFGFGLSSSLTPSQGTPSIESLGLFLVVPLLILSVCFYKGSNIIFRIFVVLQMMTIGGGYNYWMVVICGQTYAFS